MKAGLYDVIRGKFYDGRLHGGVALDAVPEGSRRLQSVLSNLNRLFNTRQGALEHLPGYGLPDVSKIYHDAPYDAEILRQEVKDAIEKYEPRLKKIYVEHRTSEERQGRLTFVITGELKPGQRVQLRTTFTSNDLIEVSRVTKNE
jgi:type VI secretion system protein